MRVFDGHNDVLALLHEAEDGNESFLEGGGDGQLTLPFAREGGMVGGLFAMFPCSPFRGVEDKHSVDYMGQVDQPEALAGIRAMVDRLARIESESRGAVRIVRDAAQLSACLDDGALARRAAYGGRGGHRA